MKVSDLMERELTSLIASDGLGLVEDIMELGRIRHLPVVINKRLVGIISQRDLLRAALSSILRLTERGGLSKLPVRAVMSKKVVTINPNATIREATELMLKKHIGCLPVVDGGALVGLLSETDCLSYLARSLGRSTERGGLQIPVRAVMSKQVVMIGPNATIHDATELMLKKRIGGLPSSTAAPGSICSVEPIPCVAGPHARRTRDQTVVSYAER